MPDHLRASDSPKRAQGGHEINRLQNVRLPLRVIPDERVETGAEGAEIHVQPRVVAEIAKSQVRQMHTP